MYVAHWLYILASALHMLLGRGEAQAVTRFDHMSEGLAAGSHKKMLRKHYLSTIYSRLSTGNDGAAASPTGARGEEAASMRVRIRRRRR